MRARPLTKNTLEEMVRRCERYSSYEVAIFVKTARDVRYVADEIHTYFGQNPIESIREIYRTHDDGGVLFFNGSRIYVKAFSESRSRENRYNCALVSEKIYLDEVQGTSISTANWCHLHAKPYRIDEDLLYEEENRIEPSQELVNFLNSLMEGDDNSDVERLIT